MIKYDRYVKDKVILPTIIHNRKTSTWTFYPDNFHHKIPPSHNILHTLSIMEDFPSDNWTLATPSGEGLL